MVSRLLAVVLILLSPAAAVAQSTFYEAYERGEDHQKAGRHQEAREAFLTAVAIHPEPAERIKTYGLNFLHQYDPYLHLAQVEIDLGLLEEAQAHLERSATAEVSPVEEIEAARIALLEALRDRQAAAAATPAPTPITPSPTPRSRPTPTPAPTVLQVESDPTGAEVFVEGLLLGISPVRIPVEPGRHHIEVRFEGHETAARDHAVGRGATDTVFFRLAPVPEPTHAPEPTAVGEPDETREVEVLPLGPPATVEPDPTEHAPRMLEDASSASIPMWLPVLLVAVIGVGLLVWSIRARRRRSRRPSEPLALTDETTIGPLDDEALPDGSDKFFGDYVLKEVLGRGGMATTYLAERTRDGKPVAIKIPHEHLLHSPEYVERFFREGKLGATVHHPNIVRIHEVGQVGARPFIAMELVQGENLAERLEEHGPMDLRSALEVARGIALALDYAHVKGIIHRDLKPANIMLLPDGTVKVLDFGIAHIADAPGLTATDRFLGTPLYSAPEAVSPTHVDSRSDLYSLGIILYTMLSGRPPFQADSPLQLLKMHHDDSLPSFRSAFEIPPRVQDLVRRLTAKAKDDRFPSAEVLLAELDAILNEI